MYNIKMVSNMLGIPAVTLRAWERRYGLTPSARTESGHRLYSDGDVEDLRWLKIQTDERGLSISHAVQNLFQQKQKKSETLDETKKENRFIDFQQSIEQYLLDYNSQQANLQLDYAFSLFHHETVFEKIMVPLLYSIGRRWEEGEVSIAQEHFATHLITQRFQKLWLAFPENRQYPKVLAFCPAEERHELGLLMFSLFLRSHGVPVIYLGADNPIDEIEKLVIGQEIQIICLSLTDSSRLQEIKLFKEEISFKFPMIKWVLGGQAFTQMEVWKEGLIGSDINSWNQWFTREMKTFEKGDT